MCNHLQMVCQCNVPFLETISFALIICEMNINTVVVDYYKEEYLPQSQ